MNTEKAQQAINELIEAQQKRQVTRKQYPVAKHQMAKLEELGLLALMPSKFGYTDAAVVIAAATNELQAVGTYSSMDDTAAAVASDLFAALNEKPAPAPEPEPVAVTPASKTQTRKNNNVQQFSITTSKFNPLENELEPADYNLIAHTAAQIISASAKPVAHTVLFESIEVYADKNSYMLISMDNRGTITWFDDARQDDATVFKGQLSYIATAMSNAVNDALRNLAKMFTVTQAATLAACNVSYIRAEIATGRLPAEKIGSQWVITREAFNDWMANPRRGSRS